MAIQSIDGIITSQSAGKEWFHIWNKITGAAAYTPGRWYDMSGLSGTPVANAWTGTALALQNTTDANTFSLYHGGNVASDTKHILHQMALTAVATGVPAFLLLQDMQCYWPGFSMASNASQAFTGGAPTLRYTNGVGCRLYLTITSTSGATAHNLSVSYTDQGGNAGQALPVTVACTASAIVPHITHSGTAANNYGPYLPLAAGDYGVQAVASAQLSASSTAGTAALVLARPLAYIPLTTASVASIVDYLNMLPSLPVVKDGACLTFLLFAGAAVGASTNFYGATGVVWG